VDEQRAEKVLSVMTPGKAILLPDIIALSGFSQDETLQILRELANRGLVKPNKLERVEEALWLPF
jgi:hypothetical protein